MPEEPRDGDEGRRRRFFAGEDPDANPLVILASYAATVIFVGALAGAACAFLPYYFTLSSSHSYNRRHDTEQLLQIDSPRIAKWRFWLGAAAGSGGTIIAMVVLNRRKRS